MATSVAEQATPKATESDHPILDWIQARQRPLGIAVLAIVLVALVAWYISESGRRKQSQAIDALDQARAVMEAGNYPEAATQLQRVVQVYAGTDAALEATLALNQVRMLSGQDQLALDELRKFIGSNPPARFLAAANSHLGMALENTGSFGEAAAAYQAAAAAATEPYLQADALLAAARCQRLAGDAQAASATLQDIIRRFPPTSPGVVEAKVRLAEISEGRT